MALKSVLPTLAALAEKHLSVAAEKQPATASRASGCSTAARVRPGPPGRRPDATAVRGRRAEHLLALAKHAERALVGPEQRVWLDPLERELEILGATMRWSTEAASSNSHSAWSARCGSGVLWVL